MAINMTAPAAYNQYECASGTIYTSDSNSNVASVATVDIPSMLGMGCFPVSTPLARSLDMLAVGKNPVGTGIAAAAAAGVFGITNTPGTTLALISEAANSNTKTDIVDFFTAMPANYVGGAAVTVTVNASITIGAGTLSVKTVNVAAYVIANDGTQGSDLINVTAKALTGNSAQDLVFSIPASSTGMIPGARLCLKLTMVLTETGASNVTGNINSVRMSA